MVHPPEIRNFAELLEPSLPPGTHVTGFSSRFFTKPGDNYGSTMLAVTAQIVDSKNNKPDQLHLVAKMRPLSEQFQEMFQIDKTFIKEAAIYGKMAPEMIKLQREASFRNDEVIDVFCRCYSTRVSLDPQSTRVDADGVLLLENLSSQGYVTDNRQKGYTSAVAEFVLKKLALFHAIPIALRFLKPAVFESSFKKYLYKINIGASFPQQIRDNIEGVHKRALEKAGVRQQLLEPIRALDADFQHRQLHLIPDELNQYSSIMHNDCKIDNIMIKYDPDGNPVAIKIFDFQLTQLESLVRDILFLLFLSVEDPKLENTIDSYLHIYFDALCSNLGKLGCPNMGQFTWESFEEELQLIAPREFPHIMFMLRVQFAKKEVVPDQSEMSTDFLCDDNAMENDYYRWLKRLVDVYEHKGWLKC